jgi:hypothetical protein
LEHTRERSNVLLAPKLASWRLTTEFAERKRKNRLSSKKQQCLKISAGSGGSVSEFYSDGPETFARGAWSFVDSPSRSFVNRTRCWPVFCLNVNSVLHPHNCVAMLGQSEPASTSAPPSTGCLLWLQLWMKLSSVDVWFNLGVTILNHSVQ